jgi:hypothetical protein
VKGDLELPKYPRNERKNRIMLSQRMFQELEDDMTEFLSFVPLNKNHFNVYSLKLVRIILYGGPEILNAFELAICNLEDKVGMHEQFNVGKYEKFGDNLQKDLDTFWKDEAKNRNTERPQSPSFNRYFCLLDEYGFNKISKATVHLKECPDVVLCPFSKNPPPEWWDVYNVLKHDKYSSWMKANLLTALTCLAALFWLVNNNLRELSRDSFSSRIFNLASG